MKQLVLFLGALGAGVLLFGVLISGVGWNEIWEVLRDFSFSHALFVFLLTLAFLSASVLRWYFILKRQGCAISFGAAWKTYLAGFSLWFFVPMFPFANELLRASLLKERYHVELPKGMASVITDRILEVTSNLLMVLVGGIIFLLLGDRVSYSSKTIAVMLFVGIWVLLLLLLYMRLFQKRSIVRLFWKENGGAQEAEQEVFRFFQVRKATFWEGIGLSLLKGIIGIVRAAVIIFFLGKGIALLPAVTAHAFYYLAVLVPIPAALGSHEVLQTLAFEALGLGAGTGVAFALVVRSIEILFAATGLILLFHFGLRFLLRLMSRKGVKLLKFIFP